MTLQPHSNGAAPLRKFKTEPLYAQVIEDLRDRIVSGQWKAHEAVPNEADLARMYEVSAGTMRKALDALESIGLVTRRQGRGTFVCGPAPQIPALAGALIDDLPRHDEETREAILKAVNARLHALRGPAPEATAPWEWDAAPACVRAVLNIMAGEWVPAADPAVPAICIAEGAEDAITSDDLRIMAEGAIRLAAWLDDRRAVAAAREAA
jgi:DNA-binding transcriptional regulator YhcF (GntR family)